VERAHIAVPEHSHPGESQSNGLAERAIREVIDEVHTHTHSKCHSRCGSKVDSPTTILYWPGWLNMRHMSSTDVNLGLMVAQRMADSMARNLWRGCVSSVNASFGLFQRNTEPSWMPNGDMVSFLAERLIATKTSSDWPMGPLLLPGPLRGWCLHCAGAKTSLD
jgi:hypothetical protein